MLCVTTPDLCRESLNGICALIWPPQGQPLNPQVLFASLWAQSFLPRGHYRETQESWTKLWPPATLRSGPSGEAGGEEWTRVRLQLVELRQAWKLLRFLVPTGAKSDT